MKKILLLLSSEKDARSFSAVMLLLILSFSVFGCTVSLFTFRGIAYVLSCIVYALCATFFCFSVIKESTIKSNATILLTLLLTESTFLITGAGNGNFRVPLAFAFYFIAMWLLHKNRTAVSVILTVLVVLFLPSAIMMLPAMAFFSICRPEANGNKGSGILVSVVCAVLAVLVSVADKVFINRFIHTLLFGNQQYNLMQFPSEERLEAAKYLLTVLPVILYIFAFFVTLIKSNRNIISKTAAVLNLAVSAIMLFFLKFDGYPTLIGSQLLFISLLYLESENDCAQKGAVFFEFAKKHIGIMIGSAVWCILFYVFFAEGSENFLLSAVSDYFSVNP